MNLLVASGPPYENPSSKKTKKIPRFPISVRIASQLGSKLLHQSKLTLYFGKKKHCETTVQSKAVQYLHIMDI